MQVALTLFDGVSADECEAFTLAFDRLDDVELIGVGARRGTVSGPGGRQRVDATFDELTTPDVVLVPGGLGVDRTATDAELLAWLRLVEPTCQWMAASSTGTVVVAAAGLLGDHPAATHWLAGSHLAEYGSAASSERIVEVGHVLTCNGWISAMDVALLMIVRLYSRDVAARVRSELASGVADRAPADTTWRQRWGQMWEGSRAGMWFNNRSAVRTLRRPRNKELETSDWIEMELIEDDSWDR